jgi:hypothetical protein
MQFNVLPRTLNLGSSCLFSFMNARCFMLTHSRLRLPALFASHTTVVCIWEGKFKIHWVSIIFSCDLFLPHGCPSFSTKQVLLFGTASYVKFRQTALSRLRSLASLRDIKLHRNVKLTSIDEAEFTSNTVTVGFTVRFKPWLFRVCWLGAAQLGSVLANPRLNVKNVATSPGPS